jgi:hypothetical protein
MSKSARQSDRRLRQPGRLCSERTSRVMTIACREHCSSVARQDLPTQTATVEHEDEAPSCKVQKIQHLLPRPPSTPPPQRLLPSILKLEHEGSQSQDPQAQGPHHQRALHLQMRIFTICEWLWILKNVKMSPSKASDMLQATRCILVNANGTT